MSSKYRQKLSWAKVEEIRARRRAGESTMELARAYGVDSSLVRRIVAGRLWTSPPVRALSDEQVVTLRERRAAGASVADLAAAYGVKDFVVRDICRGRLWPEAGGPIMEAFARGVPEGARFRPGDIVEWWCRGPDGYYVWVPCEVLAVTAVATYVRPLRPALGKRTTARQRVRLDRLRPRFTVMDGGKPTE